MVLLAIELRRVQAHNQSMEKQDLWLMAYIASLFGSASHDEPGYEGVAKNAREQADLAVRDFQLKFPGVVNE